jgi:hypothetical protein
MATDTFQAPGSNGHAEGQGARRCPARGGLIQLVDRGPDRQRNRTAKYSIVKDQALLRAAGVGRIEPLENLGAAPLFALPASNTPAGRAAVPLIGSRRRERALAAAA